jgi:hypothetical protein
MEEGFFFVAAIQYEWIFVTKVQIGLRAWPLLVNGRVHGCDKNQTLLEAVCERKATQVGIQALHVCLPRNRILYPCNHS